NSTLEYNNVAVALSSAITYRNLKLTGSGTKTFPGNTTTITGNLILNGTTISGSSSNPFSTILLAGDLTYIGTVTPPADTNSITLSTNGTAAGTQTITGAGNTVRWFRITTTTANTVVLSTTGGTSNIYLGNGAGGGITLLDASILNMNGNDFQLFNSTSIGSAAFIMTTGTISTTSSTDFLIERTVSGALGPLNFTTGSNTIGNLTLNHAGATNTLTIGNPVNVTGVITVTDGTLASGGNITLKSNASNTASIAAMGLGGSITGNVTVETFIPGGKRAYRLLGHPFSGTIALSTLIDNIHITGANGGGFDATPTNNPSAFSFNEATFNGTTNSGWSAFTNTANTIGAGQGTRILVRGPRSQSNLLDGTNPTPQAATLDFTGVVNQGTVNVAMGYTGASGANAGWNLIANPYASRVDIGSIASGNRNSIANFSVWAPNNGTRGAYVTTSFGSAYVIPAGAAFFVQTGSAANFTFTEADKSTSAVSGTLLKTDPFKLNALQLNVVSDDTLFWDQFVLRNREDALESKDAMDANKMENPDVNFYSTTNNNDRFAIDHRPLTTNSVVNLGFTTTSDYHFTFKVANLDMPGYDVYLMDKFLNKQTLLSSSTAYNFTTTADANSKGSNRFQLVFNKVASGANELNASNNFMAYPNPASSEINISLTTAAKGVYQFGLYNQLGQELIAGNFNFNTNPNQTLNIEALATGVYFIKVSNGDATQTIKFIK
ncbi:MAG: T9SS type A sorting domain-containing protein, partial [Bacteroidetes bacterium]|nr:T9SS type A sorting domain-containing protein [Bacteroidota bacterium]